ncbi:unnamed protein product [Polarella glacialis]|uniref:Uncharacterized protein n=1 Tax=Polarella glacialis TaxID=89957 RepID=A0A813GJQ1_POLGL|nr:unnamed protein product [Polarella glacialis]
MDCLCLSGHLGGKLLRLAVLAVVVPPLLLGSILQEMGLMLQEQSIPNFAIGLGEQGTAVTLEGEAASISASAVSDQTEVEMLEARAAELQARSAEEEESAMEQQEASSGFEEAEGQSVEAAEMKAAVEQAADSAVQAASAAAAETGEAVGEAAVEGAEVAAGAAQEAAAAAAEQEAAALTGEVAAAEGTALVAGSALGPVGLTVAAASVGAAIEAPKVVAEVGALQAEFEADHDEITAVEKEAQADAEEAAALTDQAGAMEAESASVAAIAMGVLCLTTGTLLQFAALVFQAPVATVVLSEKALAVGVGAYALAPGIGKLGSGGPFWAPMAANVALVPAAVAVLALPWADTITWAAELQRLSDNPLQALVQLPGFSKAYGHNATTTTTTKIPQVRHQRSPKNQQQRQEAEFQLLRRRLRSQEADSEIIGFWPDWGSAAVALEKLKDAEAVALENGQHAAADALEKGQEAAVVNWDEGKNAAADAFEKSKGATAVAWEKLQKTEAVALENLSKSPLAHQMGQTANAVKDGAGFAAMQAKDRLKRLKNGKADIRTTTVEPYTTPRPPPAMDRWFVFKTAAKRFGETFASCTSWLMRFAVDALVLFGLVVLAETVVSTGRHAPSLRQGCAHQGQVAGRIVGNIYSRWVGVAAVVVAVWVLSLLLATHLEPQARWVLSFFLSMRLSLVQVTAACAVLLLAVSGLHARQLSSLECSCERCTGAADEAGLACGSYAVVASHEEKGSSAPPLAGTSWLSDLAVGLLTVLSFAVDELLAVLERPVAAWAAGAAVKSVLAIQCTLLLLPWSTVAPTLPGGYKPSSPYQLLLPCVVLGVGIGAMLLAGRRSVDQARESAKHSQVLRRPDSRKVDLEGSRGS